MSDIFNYHPRTSSEVRVGQTPLGGDNPIRLQSMTTAATTDTAACVTQAKAIIDAGADYVRLTTQGTREAENLREIQAQLRAEGYAQPLVADVHFNPNVADVAATIVDKVRINPGNYVDPARTFKQLSYTDAEYADELRRLEKRFLQLLQLCRENKTALRIGVNHGSLSDRIMSRYGDTPEGIVESCMEFLRICKREQFHDVVISIKASNTAVMVRSVRLLCRVMAEENMMFPLHLGVTEAGEGEDGRLKSAAGIGALLSDGIGDTIRVSLSEAPEREIPVAYKIASYATRRAGHPMIPARQAVEFCYENPQRRPTDILQNIGGHNLPVVICASTDGTFFFGPQTPDYVYVGSHLPPVRQRPAGVGYIVDAMAWRDEENVFPAYTYQTEPLMGGNKSPLKFLFISYLQLDEQTLACLHRHPETVVVALSNHPNRLGEQRALVHEMWREGLKNPVVFFEHYTHSLSEREDFQIESAVDLGALLYDGLADGIFLFNEAPQGHPSIPLSDVVSTAFGILQATRLRTTKTEYISCPGCGRTLYDLEHTIARIKQATAHLKGMKIGIMGCIVNGPGEMADADYGYVGAARGKVSLYRGKVCVEKNIPEEEAVDRLLALIEADRQSTNL
ncbi:MAG: 4-hydroxy-3-methylbut-2-en-1-yl diphosphate synthase [Alloprevotella sp.]|nr:4-hydroxy-3-methylbut-2-en-1-yl diphosphate synthase [Alloprevotella sp.]